MLINSLTNTNKKEAFIPCLPVLCDPGKKRFSKVHGHFFFECDQSREGLHRHEGEADWRFQAACGAECSNSTPPLFRSSEVFRTTTYLNYSPGPSGKC